MATRNPTRLTAALLETADDMRRSGVMDAVTHDKITLRHLGPHRPAEPAPLTGADIRAIRETANLSQAVLAHYLNVTTGYVSQLERGSKRPTGPALVLLDLIRRKGIDAIL